MQCAFVLLTASALSAFCLVADQPNQKSTPADQPSADELVRRLSDRKFAVRDAAAKAIKALGPAALPALRKAKDHADPEVRSLVSKWIPEFETQALTGPRLITLRLKQGPARAALEAVAKQAGYKITFQNDAGASQSPDFNFANVPFWVAVDAICSQSGLVVTSSSDDEPAPSLVCQGGHYPYIFHHGAFRMIADQLDHSVQKHVSLNRLGGRPVPGPNVYESFSVNFTIEAEPRLHIVDASVEQVKEASDDQKHSIIAPASGNFRVMAFPGRRRHMFGPGFRVNAMSSGISLSVSLNTPSSGATTLQVLKGTVAVTIGKEHKSLLVSDKVLSAKGVKVRGQNTTLEITEVRKTPDGCEVVCAISGETGNMPDLQMTDAQGNRFEARTSSCSTNGRKVEARLHFGPPMMVMMGRGVAPGAPAKLTWNWWESVECHVPFEFRELPLP